MFDHFYSGKRVLLTGHTGFKGSWLSLWLTELGAEVHGLSLEPSVGPTLYEAITPERYASQRVCDTRDFELLKSVIADIQPEIIFHLAAQALVKRSYHEPLETFSSNATGTAHVLEAIRVNRICCTTVIVTSDKCYENREWEFSYRENDAIGGHDVYSMSKGAAELVAQSWNRSFFLNDPGLGPVVTVRAGNVIGGGDYSADRIVPDCIRSLLEQKPILIRKPSAVRPWQHVLECLSGYLCLGARVAQEGKCSALASPFNFGPDPSSRQSVRRLVEKILDRWPGEWTDDSNQNEAHEAKLLTLAIDKAVALLDWHPVWSFEEGVHATVDWYRHRHDAKNNHQSVEAFTIGQIHTYTKSAALRNLSWTV